MTDLDPRLPVVIGVGQILERDGGIDPISLIARATERAATDSGATGGVLDQIDTIATAHIVSWRYADASRAIAEAIGCADATTLYPDNGGNTPQMLMNRIGERILSGQSDLALVCGGEAYRTRMRARRDGTHLDWPKQDPAIRPTVTVDEPFEMAHAAELALGILLPTQCYPLLDNALRHHAGATADQWNAHLGQLWAGFSAVAAANPNAWDQSGRSAADIATVTPANRLIGSPYTKAMVSNPDVDMASAVLVCSVERARSLGVPRDQWVFQHSGADAKDPFLSQRPSFIRSAAIRHAGQAALELAGVGIDDVGHLDVYSCFPSAVQIACAELGIGLDRRLTTYGGLTFGGGPWNNPVGHAIVTMIEQLRADVGSFGLVTANGGHLQKHSFGVYSTSPPAKGLRTAHPQPAVDAQPAVAVHQDYTGDAVIESWSVGHERDGSPARAIATVRTPDGGRAWALSSEPDVMAACLVDDLGDVPVTVGPDSALHL